MQGEKATEHMVLCVGGVHVDRIMRPLSGVVALGQSNPVSVQATPGGVAHNVAVALAARGRAVRLVGALGDDAEGDCMLQELTASGIDLRGILRTKYGKTGSYTAVLDEAGELVIGLAEMATHDAVSTAQWRAGARYDGDIAALVLDSNLSDEAISALCDETPAEHVFAIAVSAAKARRLRPHIGRFAAVFVDRDEAAALIDLPATSVPEAIAAAEALVAAGATRVFVTLGPAGALAAETNSVVHRPAMTETVQDVTGAGDALAAGAIDCLLEDGTLESALEAGMAAARGVLSQHGAG